MKRDVSISNREYYQKNRLKILAQQREYKKTNRDDRIAKMRAYSRERYVKRDKIEGDEIVRIKMSLREINDIVYSNALAAIAYSRRIKWKQLRKDLEEINFMRKAA